MQLLAAKTNPTQNKRFGNRANTGRNFLVNLIKLG